MNEPLGPAIVPEDFRSTKHIAKRGVMWFAICMVSGAPSLVWGVGTEFNHIAMILGIVMFALGMTAVSSTDYFYRFSRKQFMRRTLYISYGVRLGLSVLFPLGAIIDMWPGILSVSIVERLFNVSDESAFISTLFITIIQGTLLNMLLSIFIGIVWSIQRMSVTPKEKHKTACASCGYDLQETTVGNPCPECGSTVGAYDFDRTLLSKIPAWGISLAFFVLTGVSIVLILIEIFEKS